MVTESRYNEPEFLVALGGEKMLVCDVAYLLLGLGFPSYLTNIERGTDQRLSERHVYRSGDWLGTHTCDCACNRLLFPNRPLVILINKIFQTSLLFVAPSIKKRSRNGIYKLHMVNSDLFSFKGDRNFNCFN